MNKKPLFIIFNDAHLKDGNEEATLISVRQMISYAKENDIKTIVFAGDMFHSRERQSESVFAAFDEILNEINSAGIHFVFFAGNHDKTSYFSHNSFLDVYRHYPNVTFTKTILDINIEGMTVTLLPFFDDSLLVPMLEDYDGDSEMLISHFEMKGSTHLGKVNEKSNITRKLLKKWKKVYLGHYHNTHEITEDIVHLPSLRQQDFGENNLKGFSVIFEDGSYQIIKGKFKEFTKITINVDEVSTEDIKNLIEEHKDSKDTVRFEFEGSKAKVQALDGTLWEGSKIDIKKKYDKTYEKTETPPEYVKKFDLENIGKAFESFCKSKELDYEKGKELLEKFLKSKKQK